MSTKKRHFTPKEKLEHTFIKLQCILLGHQFRITKRLISKAKELQCASCKKIITIDSNGELIEANDSKIQTSISQSA